MARYLSQLDAADRQEPSDALVLKTTGLREKLDKLKEEMGKLAAYEKQALAPRRPNLAHRSRLALDALDGNEWCGSGVVCYNAQVAVGTVNHLIVTHEVTNIGSGSLTTCKCGAGNQGRSSKSINLKP